LVRGLAKRRLVEVGGSVLKKHHRPTEDVVEEVTGVEGVADHKTGESHTTHTVTKDLEGSWSDVCCLWVDGSGEVPKPRVQRQ
jgi:hypothetical protein